MSSDYMDRDDSKKGDQSLSDFAKRALQSILSTEEGIRNIITAILPTDLVKDMANSVIKQMEGFRKDLVAALAQEMRRFGDNVDLTEIAKNVVDGLELDINVTIKIKDTKKKTGKKSKRSKKD